MFFTLFLRISGCSNNKFRFTWYLFLVPFNLTLSSLNNISFFEQLFNLNYNIICYNQHPTF